LARIARITAVLMRHGGGHFLSVLARRWRWLRPLCRYPVHGPDRLRMAIEELGGTFIKFGQMLALQPDILSLEYCNGLFDLLDRVSPLPYSEVERVFEEEIGRKPAGVFDFFDLEPLATASVAQVHTAWLNGRKLAVKVQRPSVEDDFAGDIRLMAAAMRLIRALHLKPLHWLIEPMSEFIAWSRDELDFRREASYMRQLRQNARENPHEQVPKLVEEFVTRRTLVMEFLPGITVLSYLRALEGGDEAVVRQLEAGGFDSHKVASHIIDNFLGDVFKHGLFHADLHPANLMILPGNVVGYIDFGISGTISAYSRQNLIALTLAYTSADLPGMCRAFFRVSAMDSSTSAERFRRGLVRDARNWYEKEGRSLRLRKNFTLVMLDMLRLSRESGVWPERDVIKYIRSAIAIDGLITRFSPTFDLGQHLRDTCDKYLKWHLRRSLLTMNTLIGWTAASVHLFRDGGLRGLETVRRLAGAPYVLEHRSHHRAADPARSRVTYVAGFLATLCFAAWLAPEPVQLGPNLFTAEVTLACAAFCRLIYSLRKIHSGVRRYA
jgi:predicted unusual protein kinase regulating ubiquinone biosynthesis (AarF/ABC1/UbiB family)